MIHCECDSLSKAADNGHANCMKILLESGMDPNSTPILSVLMQSIWGEHEECVKVLLQDSRTDIEMCNLFSETPLKIAVMRRNEACIKMLLDAGANPNGRNRYGMTPLMEAVEQGSTSCVKLLLHAGADDTLQSDTGRTALSLAIVYGHDECIRVLKEWNEISHA